MNEFSSFELACRITINNVGKRGPWLVTNVLLNATWSSVNSVLTSSPLDTNNKRGGGGGGGGGGGKMLPVQGVRLVYVHVNYISNIVMPPCWSKISIQLRWVTPNSFSTPRQFLRSLDGSANSGGSLKCFTLPYALWSCYDKASKNGTGRDLLAV